ncbi:hypothetical protein DFH06DRAFT_1188680 [Mycena polygramma]|nr:hypothetical protein DFH06DRAFT_1188680 [Mycena polygramma]
MTHIGDFLRARRWRSDSRESAAVEARTGIASRLRSVLSRLNRHENSATSSDASVHNSASAPPPQQIDSDGMSIQMSGDSNDSEDGEHPVVVEIRGEDSTAHLLALREETRPRLPSLAETAMLDDAKEISLETYRGNRGADSVSIQGVPAAAMHGVYPPSDDHDLRLKYPGTCSVAQRDCRKAEGNPNPGHRTRHVPIQLEGFIFGNDHDITVVPVIKFKGEQKEASMPMRHETCTRTTTKVPQQHYRVTLNNVGQAWTQPVRYVDNETRAGGIATWTAVAYVNDKECGSGQGKSKSTARERAARRALIKLTVIQA